MQNHFALQNAVSLGLASERSLTNALTEVTNRLKEEGEAEKEKAMMDHLEKMRFDTMQSRGHTHVNIQTTGEPLGLGSVGAYSLKEAAIEECAKKLAKQHTVESSGGIPRIVNEYDYMRVRNEALQMGKVYAFDEEQLTKKEETEEPKKAKMKKTVKALKDWFSPFV